MSYDAPDVDFPIPSRLNLFIAAAQVAAMLLIFYGASQASSALQVFLLALAAAVVGNSIYSIIHEAEHRMLHRNRRVNDCVGAIMALFFPAPYHLIRHGHLCHHRFNRSDHEAFDLYFKGDIPLVKWIKFYSIITGVYWITVVLANVAVLVCPFLLKRKYLEFDQPIAEFIDSLDAQQWRLIQLEALAAIALHSLIIIGFGIPLLTYVCVYFGFGFAWSAMQYVHHYGTMRHVLRAPETCGYSVQSTHSGSTTTGILRITNSRPSLGFICPGLLASKTHIASFSSGTISACGRARATPTST